MATVSPPARKTGIFLCSLVLCLVLAGGATLPFLYESTTMLYKFGMDKALLRAGKIAGISAVILFAVQHILAGRFRLLDGLFGLNTLLRLHRINGLLIIALTVVHLLLILVPEGIDNLPIGKKFIPEMIGMLIVLIMLPLGVFALKRAALPLPYHLWLTSHRLIGFILVPVIFLHVRLVSDPFEKGIPLLLLSILTLLLLVLGLRRLKRSLLPAWDWTVKEIIPHSANIHTLTFSHRENTPLAFTPGQFIFLRLDAPEISREEHPFSLSSGPAESSAPAVTIKSCGDWTNKIGGIPAGTRASLSVPYGQFSYINDLNAEAVLLVAGGIGITPLMSMLRHMAETGEQRKVHLLWSYKNQGDLIFEDELPALEQKMANLTFTCRCTDPARGGSRLTPADIEQACGNLPPGCSAYICGPPAMVESVRRILSGLGFPRSRIHFEHFAL